MLELFSVGSALDTRGRLTIHHLTVIVGEEVGITVGDAVVAPYVGTMLLLGEADEIMLGRRDSCNDGDVVGLSVLSTEGNADGTKVGSAVGIGAVGALVTYIQGSVEVCSLSMSFNETHI